MMVHDNFNPLAAARSARGVLSHVQADCRTLPRTWYCLGRLFWPESVEQCKPHRVQQVFARLT